MSLVGPRPPLPGEVDALQPTTCAVGSRVRPGMTGLWQVSGRSDLSLGGHRPPRPLLRRQLVDGAGPRHPRPHRRRGAVAAAAPTDRGDRRNPNPDPARWPRPSTSPCRYASSSRTPPCRRWPTGRRRRAAHQGARRVPGPAHPAPRRHRRRRHRAPVGVEALMATLHDPRLAGRDHLRRRVGVRPRGEPLPPELGAARRAPALPRHGPRPGPAFDAAVATRVDGALAHVLCAVPEPIAAVARAAAARRPQRDARRPPPRHRAELDRAHRARPRAASGRWPPTPGRPWPWPPPPATSTSSAVTRRRPVGGVRPRRRPARRVGRPVRAARGRGPRPRSLRSLRSTATTSTSGWATLRPARVAAEFVRRLAAAARAATRRWPGDDGRAPGRRGRHRLGRARRHRLRGAAARRAAVRARRGRGGVWRAVAQGGTLDDVTRRVADESGHCRGGQRRRRTFVGGLVDTGLVVRCPSPPPGSPSHD